MRKGDDREKKRGEKIMMKIMATNVVASRPPNGGPTGTPTARAKKEKKIKTFLVATSIVASRPPKRRPTGMPHARANIFMWYVLMSESSSSSLDPNYRKWAVEKCPRWNF